jgi:hypothetical protein
MGGGYVLDFSDRTFSAFFAEELGITIDEPRYSAEGTSKAKRLRYFLKTCDPSIRTRTLLALWEYREANRRRNRVEERVPGAEAEFSALIERLGGRPPSKAALGGSPRPSASATIDVSVAHALRNKLLQVSRLAPQSRGFAYERFWKELFDANGLAPRASFRVVGEQIDGTSSYPVRRTCSKPSGRAFRSAQVTCTLFTEKWWTRPRGRGDCSSVTAGLPRRD